MPHLSGNSGEPGRPPGTPTGRAYGSSSSDRNPCSSCCRPSSNSPVMQRGHAAESEAAQDLHTGMCVRYSRACTVLHCILIGWQWRLAGQSAG